MLGLNRFQKILISVTFLSVTTHAFELANQNRYYPSEFYQRVSAGEVDSDLKKDLFTIMSSVHIALPGQNDEIAKECPADGSASCYRHTSLGYTMARRILFGQLHLETTPDGHYAVRDVYCQHLTVDAEFERNPPGPGQIPDSNVINAEHTWPQSRFSTKFNKDMQKSDLHILYPAMAEANTSRSNNEFSDVVSTITSPCKPSKRGYSSRGTTHIYFEPPDNHKGNAARAIFYFAVRYNLHISPDEEESLKAWHHLDPVDDFERKRHETIFAKQKDRNPFIDHPELVDLIHDF